jgi:hypothetical protein
MRATLLRRLGPIAAVVLWASVASGQIVLTVSSLANTGAGTLRNTIATANTTSGAVNIVFSISGGGTINLSGDMPALTNPSGISIDGTNGGQAITINAGGIRPFFIGINSADNTTGFTATASTTAFALSNLTISNGSAIGGSGGTGGQGGGGGGAGLGGAVFVNAGTLTVSNMTFSNNQAIGGNGATGSGNFSAGSGGGGGMGGSGGSSSGSGTRGGAGGGGFGTGSLGGNSTSNANGGGGTAGSFSNGTIGGVKGGNGGAGQSQSAAPLTGGTGGNNGGGGGGGGSGNSLGGSAYGSGGGGGVGGVAGQLNGNAGDGGFGGGGGGSDNGGPGGNGGFGGGGGGSGFAAGGTGGFGGGGGGSAAGNASVGGVGGGAGTGSSPFSGGGGAGFGGAIFVRQNATLIVSGANTFTSNTVTGGTGANPGQAQGQSMYVAGSVQYVFPSGSSTISDTISGAISGGFQKNGAGTLVLSGANTYTGGTTISGGILRASNTTGSATGSDAVTVANGGTLGGGNGGATFADSTNGFLAGAVTIQSGGHLAPGASVGLLTDSNTVTFNAGSFFDVELGTHVARPGASPVDNNSNDRIHATINLQFGADLTVNVDGLGQSFTPGSTYDYFLGRSDGAVGTLPGTITINPTNFASGASSSNFLLSRSADTKSLILTFTPTPVPEPGSLALVGLATGVVGWRLRRRAR